MLSRVIDTLNMIMRGLEQLHDTDILSVVIGEVDCRTYMIIS